MKISLEQIKSEIEGELKNIEHFFENALNAYGPLSPSKAAREDSNDGVAVTEDLMQKTEGTFFKDYMMIVPALLWRFWDNLRDKLGREYAVQYFEFKEPKFDRSGNLFKDALCYLKFFIERKFSGSKLSWHYIGPREREIEEIRELRNYFLHNHHEPSSGLCRKYYYEKNQKIKLSEEKIYSFFDSCEKAKDTIFDDLFNKI